ncbi:MAG: hypothetical protein KIS66_08655 [Fimbriimonadaceae bacterium]|nr:hypothetical protein [Fimbriimonadaceae bacterium]
MSLAELRKLTKLHLLDQSIREIRARAAALDGGKRILAQIDKIKQDNAEILADAHRLSAEQKDLELQSEGIDAKLKKFEGELYGGKIVNSREIQNVEKEIEALKRQRGHFDERLLELMELVPAAREQAKHVEEALAQKDVQLAEYRVKAAEARTQLEAEFKKRMEMRPKLVAEIDPSLYAKYDHIRQKHGGVGLAIVDGRACGACGTQVPTRVIVAAQEGKVVLCEACHRLLVATEGVV